MCLPLRQLTNQWTGVEPKWLIATNNSLYPEATVCCKRTQSISGNDHNSGPQGTSTTFNGGRFISPVNGKNLKDIP